jgi:hypothetical protein
MQIFKRQYLISMKIFVFFMARFQHISYQITTYSKLINNCWQILRISFIHEPNQFVTENEE